MNWCNAGQTPLLTTHNLTTQQGLGVNHANCVETRVDHTLRGMNKTTINYFFSLLQLYTSRLNQKQKHYLKDVWKDKMRKVFLVHDFRKLDSANSHTARRIPKLLQNPPTSFLHKKLFLLQFRSFVGSKKCIFGEVQPSPNDCLVQNRFIA